MFLFLLNFCFYFIFIFVLLKAFEVIEQQRGSLKKMKTLEHHSLKGILSFYFSYQVTSLLRRVLPEVTPNRLASIIGVKSLPPADISDIIHSTEKGDWNKLGILDMFLGCIAKALTVQLKAKGTTITGTAGTTVGKGVTTVTLPMIFNSRLVIASILVLK